MVLFSHVQALTADVDIASEEIKVYKAAVELQLQSVDEVQGIPM